MEWISLGTGIAALILSVIAILIINYANSQSDSRARVIEAIQDLDDSIKAIEEYQSKGTALMSNQFDALASAASKKREARRLRSLGNYNKALTTADEGFTILEQNFPSPQFPAAFFTRRELGIWRGWGRN